VLAVGPMGQLVDVVAGLVEETKQPGLLDARFGPRDDLRLVDEAAIPEKSGGLEAGGLDLSEIRLVVGIRQSEADQAGEIFSLGFRHRAMLLCPCQTRVRGMGSRRRHPRMLRPHQS